MPSAAIAAAVCSTSCALTLQPNAFQSFQPIGGVSASPSSRASAGLACVATAAAQIASAAASRAMVLRIATVRS